MRTLVLVLAIFLAFNFGHSQIEKDKVLHFAGGALFGLAGAGIAKEISNGDRTWTFVGAVGGALLVGLGKEAIDSGQDGNSWDNGDVLATALGGFAVGLTIDVFTKKKRKKQSKITTLYYPRDINFLYNNSLPTLTELQFSTSILYTE
ncbi:hypothetical protein ACFSQJ_15130 [Croceitalea marina]|uniref:Glycine zipper 2TM domain-containing protein n=1 Tax=Croceitalea marina TaxID=1775166 RepID=A0ABW5MYM0_9FLAO